MATVEMQPRSSSEGSNRTAFLIVDTESVPDGRLLNQVRYSEECLSEGEAIERAREEARDSSWNGSDFIPVSYHYPVGICVIRVGADLTLQRLTCLDAPNFRTREIVKQFWAGVNAYPRAKLVTFNGRGFDLPLLELGAFRFGYSGRDYFQNGRNRFNGHIDLLDWFTNFGAWRLQGGLDVLAKLIGKPGKMSVSGDQVLEMFRQGRLQEINDYCLCDTLDTYFIFLRTRVMTGDITLEMETELIQKAREFLESKTDEFPVLSQYLDHWVDTPQWP